MVQRGSDVLRAVCDYYSPEGSPAVTDRILRGRENGHPIDEARGVLVYLWREDCGYSTYKAGWLLCRNQSTAWRLEQDVRAALACFDQEIMSAVASVRAIARRVREVSIGANAKAGHHAAGDNGQTPPAA